MDWLNNNAINLSQKSLDFLWQKQRVISENVANGDTPGYKAKYVTFEDELRSNLSKFGNGQFAKSSDIAKEIQNSKMMIHQSDDESIRMDGNNVNVDVENVELARTQLQYQYMANQISDQFTRLRMVITGE
ncbi:flagellar basal body rod protein FlgB [Anaerovorax odorimutans]|uniref:flagellar basal body rod protein FlgB n=1 Tax=Anaerovorax odorimutans TaxID=109327 RepID=UPI0004004389|nr:flagellar basal body rod protein FlgB [Anaerovorax odorimutans]